MKVEDAGPGASSQLSRRPADRFMRRLLRLSGERKAGSLAAARNALGTGIVLSGLRCLFTYLVFPLLGPIGALGALRWPLSFALGALAVVFSIRSTRRFWAADHRHRWTYTAFAGVIISYVLVDLTWRAINAAF